MRRVSNFNAIERCYGVGYGGSGGERGYGHDIPMVEDETGAEQEPTLLLDEAMLLSEAIAAETRAVAIRLPAAQLAGKQMLAKLAGVLRASPGSCPVQLVIETEEGAEAFLSLGPTRVAPSDALLSALDMQRRLLDHLGISAPITLLGHSMGGAVVTQL